MLFCTRRLTRRAWSWINVWAMEKFKEIKLMPKVKDLKMVAANGTDIGNYGQKLIKSRGVAATTTSTFTRLM